jgi:hypothetical protein
LCGGTYPALIKAAGTRSVRQHGVVVPHPVSVLWIALGALATGAVLPLLGYHQVGQRTSPRGASWGEVGLAAASSPEVVWRPWWHLHATTSQWWGPAAAQPAVDTLSGDAVLW